MWVPGSLPPQERVGGPRRVRWAGPPRENTCLLHPLTEDPPLFPPLPFQPDHPLMASALLQLRGDVKETYKVLFVAQVVTGP